MKINLPTKITISRIVLVFALLIFLFVFVILGKFNGYVSPRLGDTPIYVVNFVAFIVFVVASSTDWLDGHLARKNNQVTTLGKFLDPIADKMLVNSMLIFLIFPWEYYGANGGNIYIPVYCVILMIIRDLVVDTLRFVAASKNEVIAANIFGKLKTVFQMIAIPIVLLNGWPFSYFDASWPVYCRISMIFIYLATLMSVISGVIYVIQNFHCLKEVKK